MAITKVRASSIDLTTDTTQLSMAKGTTAQRPTGASSLSAEYLIVAGGGGGGGFGGGGGAGGLLTNTITLPIFTDIGVTIGTGGAGDPAGSPYANGTNGNNSLIVATGINTITTIGGGGGGYYNNNVGLAGGSGGGGGAATGLGTGAVGPNGGAGTTGQGNTGGKAGGQLGSSPYYYEGGGGGGGAGAVGGNGYGNTYGQGGSGGDGIQSSITGVATYYAGGGGGYSDNRNVGVSTGSPGGQGGGGTGSTAGNNGTDATNGLGGGGGGGGYSYGQGGAGGNGVVIFKVPDNVLINTIAGTAPTLNPDGAVANYNIYKFLNNAIVQFYDSSSLEDGLVRFNTDTGKFEFFKGSWHQVVYV